MEVSLIDAGLTRQHRRRWTTADAIAQRIFSVTARARGPSSKPGVVDRASVRCSNITWVVFGGFWLFRLPLFGLIACLLIARFQRASPLPYRRLLNLGPFRAWEVVPAPGPAP